MFAIVGFSDGGSVVSSDRGKLSPKVFDSDGAVVGKSLRTSTRTSSKEFVRTSALISRAGEINKLAAADTITIPRVELLWLAAETLHFLERLEREVRENKNVMLASQFGRWLQFSGLLKIFERVSSVQGPIPFDAKVLSTKLNDLLFNCGELFRGGKADPKYAASDIAEINRKLDLLAQEFVKKESPVVTICQGQDIEPKGAECVTRWKPPAMGFDEKDGLLVKSTNGHARVRP